MLKIRLARAGAKKRPYYKIVIADARAPRDGKYIEKVGTYNPMLPKGDENRVKLITDRIKYWIGEGAQATDRVSIFLGNAGIMDKPTFNNPNKAKASDKTIERQKEKDEKLAAAKEAEAEASAVEEAPVEEVVAEEAPVEEAPVAENTEEEEKKED